MKKIILIVLVLSIAGIVTAQQDYNQELEKAALSIAEKIKTAGKKNIAVLEFENSNKQISELGSWLSGVFTTHLENSAGVAFSVKNNTDVAKAVQQIKTESGSGAFDSQSIQRLGEISGSDVVIYGIITLMDEEITVNIKAVNPSGSNQSSVGGTIVSFAATEGMRSKYDNYLDDKPANTGGGQVSPGSASGEGTARTSKNVNCKEQNSGDYCFVNNRKEKLTIQLLKKYRIAEITVDPGQTQCVYDIGAGVCNYEIFETNVGAGMYYIPANGGSQLFKMKGQIYFEQCKSKTFIIR